jgi:hypothetical protein
VPNTFLEQAMVKRTRDKDRFEQLYSLAEHRHRAGLTDAESDEAFRSWVHKNTDLKGDKSIATAHSEYQKMAHPRLSGFLPQIRKLAHEIMDREPVGTKLRENHEFLKICRIARDHPISVSKAILEVAEQKNLLATSKAAT